MSGLLDGRYPDVATFVKAKSSGYSGSKVLYQQFDCAVIFLQATDFVHTSYQDNIDADAICYPDPSNASIMALANRLEGLYVLMPLYGGSDAQSWYKVTRATVNRDHLLGNTIDNIQLELQKSEPVPGVS